MQLDMAADFIPPSTHNCNECTEHLIQDVIDLGSLAIAATIISCKLSRYKSNYNILLLFELRTEKNK